MSCVAVGASAFVHPTSSIENLNAAHFLSLLSLSLSLFLSLFLSPPSFQSSSSICTRKQQKHLLRVSTNFVAFIFISNVVSSRGIHAIPSHHLMFVSVCQYVNVSSGMDVRLLCICCAFVVSLLCVCCAFVVLYKGMRSISNKKISHSFECHNSIDFLRPYIPNFIQLTMVTFVGFHYGECRWFRKIHLISMNRCFACSEQMRYERWWSTRITHIFRNVADNCLFFSQIRRVGFLIRCWIKSLKSPSCSHCSFPSKSFLPSLLPINMSCSEHKSWLKEEFKILDNP